MTDPRPIYPKHFLSEPVAPANTGFILMPFEPRAAFDPIHRAIAAGIEEAGLTPRRADDIFNTRAGMEKILRGIAEAEVIVADMTGRNANVFYETGIAHTIKDNVVLLTQNIEDIPFDFRHIDHIEYEPTEVGRCALTDELHKVISGLPHEPAAGASSNAAVAPAPPTAEETGRRLRDLLLRCEEAWRSEVVPSQGVLFENRYRGRFAKGPEQGVKQAIGESMAALHRAFLQPWAPIEELGFDVIAANGTLASVLPDLLKALERAYNLGKRVEGHPTVVGHGQLLVLRSWSFWGAFALERQNWKAVAALLHRQLTFDKPTWGEPRRASLAARKYVYGPDAAGRAQGYGYIDLATRFVFEQGETLASGRFIDAEEARGFISLWLLASDIAEAATREDHSIDWPVWSYAPRADFDRLIPLLEEDADYVQGFADAVAKLDPAELNQLWESGLRAKFMDPSALGVGGWQQLAGRRLPKHFAE